MAVLKEVVPQPGCRMCRQHGVPCADLGGVDYQSYYQLVPGVGYVTGPGTARRGSMAHELTTKVPGGRKTDKRALEAFEDRQQRSPY